MSVAVTLEELSRWNQQASAFWNKHLDANPALLELPCDIGGTKNVQEFVRHIWGAELRWAHRLAGLPETPREQVPTGPLAALFDLHLQATQIFDGLLKAPEESWQQTLTFEVITQEKFVVSRRKVAAHMLFHSQRHWAQLATLVRAAGFPSGFRGDILLSAAFD
jgi:uncharacterized damage-inducible protein DinB